MRPETTPSIPFVNFAGAPIQPAPDALAALRAALPGRTLAAGEPGYDESRGIWNAMIDRRPALVARCADPGEVQTAVRFAAAHGIALAVRGGGHNIGGRALVEGSLLLDFSAHRDVRLDEATGEVVAAPGALLGDLDRATAPRGWVVPSGIVSETGLAGLTLGGGFGWLSRRWGLTCDHLIGAEVITTSGERLEVDERHHPDLFWALRGGGGGFAIVTSFRFAARRMDPTVLAGPIFHRPEATAAAAERFRAQTLEAPEEVGSLLRLGAAPPAPFLPEELHGRPVAVAILCHGGESERAAPALAPFRAGGGLAADLVQPRPFAAFQAMFDAGEPRGKRNYWKSEYVEALDDETLAILLEAHRHLPSPSANIKVFSLGGAVARVPADATAAAHRDARYIVVVATSWDDPAADAANIGWVRDAWRRVHARSGRGGYVNFLTDDRSPEETRAALAGVDLARLRAVRRTWDPSGLLGGEA